MTLYIAYDLQKLILWYTQSFLQACLRPVRYLALARGIENEPETILEWPYS